MICNEIFLKEFLAKIFKLKWFDLIKVMLDLAYDKNNKRLETNFIYINNDYTMKNESYFDCIRRTGPYYETFFEKITKGPILIKDIEQLQ